MSVMASFSQAPHMPDSDIASLLGAMMELGDASAESVASSGSANQNTSLQGSPTQVAGTDMQSLLEEPIVTTPAPGEPLAKRQALSSSAQQLRACTSQCVALLTPASMHQLVVVGLF